MGILEVIPRALITFFNKISMVLLILGLISLYLTKYNNESLPIAVLSVSISTILIIVTTVMLKYSKE
ncbi:MAG: hypothetical protein ACRC7N_02845 [Clostridium sp.]